MSAAPLFPATRWTLLQTLREGSDADALEALELLCRAYWMPLYMVARRFALKPEDAEDLVQGFFESLLEADSLQNVDPSLGRLRSYLLKSFQNYQSKQWHASRTMKRGGVIDLISHTLMDEAEAHFLQIADEKADIETLYNREWTRLLLERSLEKLRQQHLSKDLGELFDELVVHLTRDETEAARMASAEKLGLSSLGFRQAVFRMRRAYRGCIEDELAMTLGTSDPEVIRREVCELFKSFE